MHRIFHIFFIFSLWICPRVHAGLRSVSCVAELQERDIEVLPPGPNHRSFKAGSHLFDRGELKAAHYEALLQSVRKHPALALYFTFVSEVLETVTGEDEDKLRHLILFSFLNRQSELAFLDMEGHADPFKALPEFTTRLAFADRLFPSFPTLAWLERVRRKEGNRAGAPATPSTSVRLALTTALETWRTFLMSGKTQTAADALGFSLLRFKPSTLVQVPLTQGPAIPETIFNLPISRGQGFSPFTLRLRLMDHSFTGPGVRFFPVNFSGIPDLKPWELSRFASGRWEALLDIFGNSPGVHEQALIGGALTLAPSQWIRLLESAERLEFSLKAEVPL